MTNKMATKLSSRVKYHLTNFILKTAYSGQFELCSYMKPCDPVRFWQSWVNDLKRMFPYKKLPRGLIAGLRSKKNQFLNTVIASETTLEDYILHLEAQNYKRHLAWEEKNAQNRLLQLEKKL